MTPMQQKSVASEKGTSTVPGGERVGSWPEGGNGNRPRRAETDIPDTVFQNFFFFLFRLPDPTHYVGRTTLTCRGHFAYFFVGTHGF